MKNRDDFLKFRTQVAIIAARCYILGMETVNPIVFILTAVLVVAKLVRRFGEWLDKEI